MNVSVRLTNDYLDTLTLILNFGYPHGHHWQLAAWGASWTQHCPKAQALEANLAYDVNSFAVDAQDLPKEGSRRPLDENELVHHPLENGAAASPPSSVREDHVFAAPHVDAMVFHGQARGILHQT